MEFNFSSISQYHKQLRDGAISCVETLEYYLHQIQKYHHLNAFVEVFTQSALAQAKALDGELAAGKPLRPLHGVIAGIKDVLCYQDHPVSAGSRMLRGFKSPYSATVIQKLIDAGAVIIGSCNCDEFGMGSTNENSAFGPVLNPADNGRVPGGSSGGSAAAIQAGLCMISLGSDTGGSVRQPANFCGVVGLKPTYGRISRYGLIAYASSFDCVGIFAKTVEDVSKVYDSIAGYDPLDSTSVQPTEPEPIPNEPPFRFAYFPLTLELPGLDPEIKSKTLELFTLLQNQGHTVLPVEFTLLDYLVPAYYVLTTAEASSNLSRYDGIRYGHQSSKPKKDLTEFYKLNRSEGFGPEVKRRIMLGSFVLSAGYYDAYYSKAQQVRRMLVEQTAHIFNGFDALLMPVAPSTAFRLGEKLHDPVAMYLADIYTVFANLTGIPAMSVPLFTHSNGLSFGIQIHTNRWNELLLHRICRYFEQLQE